MIAIVESKCIPNDASAGSAEKPPDKRNDLNLTLWYNGVEVADYANMSNVGEGEEMEYKCKTNSPKLFFSTGINQGDVTEVKITCTKDGSGAFSFTPDPGQIQDHCVETKLCDPSHVVPPDPATMTTDLDTTATYKYQDYYR